MFDITLNIYLTQSVYLYLFLLGEKIGYLFTFVFKYTYKFLSLSLNYSDNFACHHWFGLISLFNGI